MRVTPQHQIRTSARRGRADDLQQRSAAPHRAHLSWALPGQRTTRSDRMIGRAPGRSASCWQARYLAAAISAIALLTVATTSSAHAETTQVLAFASSVEDVFNNIRNWLVGILAGLATVFLTVGGVRYLMAGGDPGEVEKAKTAFKSAGWGYGLAALAPLVVEILKGIVGA